MPRNSNNRPGRGRGGNSESPGGRGSGRTPDRTGKRAPFSRDGNQSGEKPAWKKKSLKSGSEDTKPDWKRKSDEGGSAKPKSSWSKFREGGSSVSPKPAWKKKSTGRNSGKGKPAWKGRGRTESRKGIRPENESSGPEGVRLNKFIANAGICSRREADDFIEAGVVSINGKVVTAMGIKINPGDVVRFHDKIISGEKKVYLLLNKPKDYITTTDDPLERKTVMVLVKAACRERIYPVGRLDRATTGVLLFTNDGDLTKKLTHPSHHIRKVYLVELDMAITSAHFDKVMEGVSLEDGLAQVDGMAYAGTGSDRKILVVEIHSGRNRIVRRIFESLGYTIRKLDRISFAGLTKKELKRGGWRFLTEKEVGYLKMQTGLTRD